MMGNTIIGEAVPHSPQSREAIEFFGNCRVRAKPLGPGIYGVPAIIGPDLVASAFHDEHVKEDFIGRVKHISVQTATMWVEDHEQPWRPAVAGWQPERSCVVVWPLPKRPHSVLAMLPDDRTFWYTACDEGVFEISYCVPISGRTQFDAAVLFKEDLRIAHLSAHCMCQHILAERIGELLLGDERDMALMKKLEAIQKLLSLIHI